MADGRWLMVDSATAHHRAAPRREDTIIIAARQSLEDTRAAWSAGMCLRFVHFDLLS
jgi:hypothetical protein